MTVKYSSQFILGIFKKFRILTNGTKYRLQRRYNFFFWNDISVNGHISRFVPDSELSTKCLLFPDPEKALETMWKILEREEEQKTEWRVMK